MCSCTWVEDTPKEASGLTRRRCLVRLYEDWYRRNSSATPSHEEGRRKGRDKKGLLGATMVAAMAGTEEIPRLPVRKTAVDMINARELQVVIVGPDEELRKHGDVSRRINRKRKTWRCTGDN